MNSNDTTSTGSEVLRGDGQPFGQFASRRVRDPGYSPSAIRVYTVPVTYADISKTKRVRVLGSDGHTCLACGAAEHLTLDHIVHRPKGGGNEDSNLRTLCLSCNSKRNNGYLKEVDR